MLFALALALALFAPCRVPAQTTHAQEAARQGAAEQRVDIETALRERGVEVEFSGNQVFTRRELLDILSCDEQTASYFVEGSAAERFSDDDKNFQKLEYSLFRFRQLLNARGYLKASVSDPRAETSAAGRKLLVSINEGALYRIGKVEFKGSKLISPERLAEMFPLKAGDVANGSAIYVFLFERVKKHYADHGYIQYEADPDPTYKSEPGAREGVVDFLIQMAEGNRFTLRSVEFEGNVRTADEQVRPLLLLREGETYRQALLDESLKKLEATGLFERIDPDKDVDYRTDAERTGLTVKIKLKERSIP